jgi:Transcriptional regulator, contains sigma factor-related N-terminal domain
MFDKKSDYALNKREKDAIVYISATSIVYLTRADFSNEDEFLEWKRWSDGDYQTCEQANRGFYDNSIPLDETLDMIGAVDSIQDELFGRLDEAEHRQIYASLLKQIKRHLTEKQYRRLWLYYVDGMTIERIALAEGVTHQNVSKTIVKAKNKIKKYFKNRVQNRTFFCDR